MMIKFVLSLVVFTFCGFQVNATTEDRLMGNYPEAYGQQRPHLEENFKILQLGYDTMVLYSDLCKYKYGPGEKLKMDEFSTVTLTHIDRAINDGVITVETFDKLPNFARVKQYLRSGHVPDCANYMVDPVYVPFVERYFDMLADLMLFARGGDPTATVTASTNKRDEM